MARKSILYHLTFWIISFILLYRLFTINYDNGWADVIYTLLFHLPLLVATYVNVYLVDRLLRRKLYGGYIAGALATLAVSVAFYFFIFEVLSDLLFPGYYFIAYYSAWEISQFVLVYIVISLLLKLSIDWFAVKEDQLSLQRENYTVKLRNLKAQINPHFLFNSLNNIYSLADGKDTRTRAYLVKLADALRYMIYDTDEDFVPLPNEIEYLENYVALEKLRLEDPGAVRFEARGNADGLVIAPLLLLPLVENCFKHARRPDPAIHIMLTIGPSLLQLHTRNNLALVSPDEKGGHGLQNVRKRLAMIYPQQHQLHYRQEDGQFHAQLEINLDR